MLADWEYTADRYCPVFERIIDCEWCYECVLGLSRAIKVEAVRELDEIEDIATARKICAECRYSNLE